MNTGQRTSRKRGPKPKHSGVEAKQHAKVIQQLQNSIATQQAALLALQSLGNQGLVQAAQSQAQSQAQSDDKTPRPSLLRRASGRDAALKTPKPKEKPRTTRRQIAFLTPAEKGAIVCLILCFHNPGSRSAVAACKKAICKRDKTGRTTLKRVSNILVQYNKWREASAENRTKDIQQLEWPRFFAHVVQHASMEPAKTSQRSPLA